MLLSSFAFLTHDIQTRKSLKSCKSNSCLINRITKACKFLRLPNFLNQDIGSF